MPLDRKFFATGRIPLVACQIKCRNFGGHLIFHIWLNNTLISCPKEGTEIPLSEYLDSTLYPNLTVYRPVSVKAQPVESDLEYRLIAIP